MSEDIKQETQEVENIEIAEDTSASEDTEITTKETAVEGAVEETAAIEVAEEEVEPAPEEELDTAEPQATNDQPPVELTNYLDPSILDVKIVNKEELGQYDEITEISDDLYEQYSETFADIREKEVVTGSVVGITDRDVLLDIGFKRRLR